MSFAEQASVTGREGDAECTSVLEPERQRPPDERDICDFVVGGSFEPVQPGHRHAAADEHALIPGDRVAHPSQDEAAVHELAGP